MNVLDTMIVFCLSSFDSMEDQSNLVLKARHLIEMTHHSRPVFETNVHQALVLYKCVFVLVLIPWRTNPTWYWRLDTW